jgi:hypothetical protein
MPKLYVKYAALGTAEPKTVMLENVADAGIANDFLVIRYTDGVVTFTKTEQITDVQFDPTEDAEEEGAGGEDTNDTTDQQ